MLKRIERPATPLQWVGVLVMCAGVSAVILSLSVPSGPYVALAGVPIDLGGWSVLPFLVGGALLIIGIKTGDTATGRMQPWMAGVVVLALFVTLWFSAWILGPKHEVLGQTNNGGCSILVVERSGMRGGSGTAFMTSPSSFIPRRLGTWVHNGGGSIQWSVSWAGNRASVVTNALPAGGRQDDFRCR